ncbi:protein spinster-like [Artemia franciscana]|uniref:protein spinster-like n=1 Tax=Artemia franciscana TaxID=6661 RepID=UPI0032DBBD36
MCVNVISSLKLTNGVLDDIQIYYSINDSRAGLIQTVFTVSYMMFAPLFGYLGDRYSRRTLIAISLFIGSLAHLSGSFMTEFWSFVATRVVFGIGAAGFITIAPTIISDIYAKDMRSRMLALFCFAIPVGSGLGYIVGSEAASVGQDWRWALRVTPTLGLICLICVLFTLDPIRGKSEGGAKIERTSWGEDIKYLLHNPTYVLTTCGVTCVNFIAGSLTWWGAKYIILGQKLQGALEDQENASFVFGVIAMLAGIFGVLLGVTLSQKLRTRFPRSDPLICGIGLLISAPLILAGLLVADTYTNLCFVLIFFGQVFLNMNWSIATDIKLYVVVPTRRSTASALQIFTGKALGDAISPYLIGLISDTMKPVIQPKFEESLKLNPLPIGQNSSLLLNTEVNFLSLQYASYVAIVVQVLGGFFFVAASLFLLQDKSKVDLALAESGEEDEERLKLTVPVQREMSDLSNVSPVSVEGEALNVPT